MKLELPCKVGDVVCIADKKNNVDYLQEKREIRINLPEEVWKNIDTIIMTRLFQEELVVEKQKEIGGSSHEVLAVWKTNR